ncbi:MAG: hypothetical protein OSJ54_12780 [Oscillospiraceae bacterium]|nr:hypothetical protein [Oscillospiraceae bacterium]
MIPEEIEGKKPDKVMVASDGRRIELYGQPSKELLAHAVCRVLVQKKLAEIEEAIKANT